MRICVVGDVHLADRPPTNRTYTYTGDIFTKLMWIKDQLYDCQYLIFLGDIFHSKNKVSHALVNRFLAWLNTVPIPVCIVPGNHDLQGSYVGSVKIQPIGTLAEHPMVHVVPGAFQLSFNGQNLKCLGIPGVPIDQLHWPVNIDLHRYDVVFSHQAVTVPGSSLPFEHFRPEHVRDLAPYHFFGHYHVSTGVFNYGGTQFVGTGSISRISSHESDVLRQPKIWFFDTSNGGLVSWKDVPVRPPEEVYKIKQIRERVVKIETHDEFVSRLSSLFLSSLSLDRVRELIQSSDTPQAVKDKALALVESEL